MFHSCPFKKSKGGCVSCGYSFGCPEYQHPRYLFMYVITVFLVAVIVAGKAEKAVEDILIKKSQ